MNWELIYNELPNLGQGALITLQISFVALFFGNFLGLIAAIFRLSKFSWLNKPTSTYVAAFRGTPMLVQIYFFHYGIIPSLGYTRSPAIYAGIIALSLNSAAYMCEIFRGGIQSIDKGQTEAALSLGLSKVQTMRHVVLPQALANAMPAIGNEFITLIKDSSLVSIISVAELTYRANLVAARNWEYNSMYLSIAVMYFIMTQSTAKILGYMERRLRTGYAK